MLETEYSFQVLKSELRDCIYFETTLSGCCCYRYCRRLLLRLRRSQTSISYTVSEQQLLWVAIYFVCVNFRKFMQLCNVQQTRVCYRLLLRPLLLLLSAASAVGTSPVAGAIAAAARVLKQLTASDQQFILLKLCISGCARVFGYGSES